MITINAPVVKVFTKWQTAMTAIKGFSASNVSFSPSGTVASTPYVRIFLMGNPTMTKDLEGNETSTELSFQVDLFASGETALTDLLSYDEISHKTMVDMGFERVYGQEFTDNADESIKRLTSRYSMTCYTNNEI